MVAPENFFLCDNENISKCFILPKLIERIQKQCLKVLMLFHFFVDSGNLFHFEGPKKESEF